VTRVGLAALLLLVACNEGNLTALAQPDMSSVSDLSTSPDLTSTTSCGQIAMCVLGCAQDPTCLGGCFMGADPQSLTELGSLLVCAGTNCLQGAGGDGGLAGLLGGGGLGSIDQTQLLTCLVGSCQQQITACPGLFGGF
jgi:hypothetical protein